MSLADNTIHPLEIPDAREAAYKASELQKQVEDSIREASKTLAEKERAYRKALAEKILDLRRGADAPAWTTCQDIARGDKDVVKARYERDVQSGVLEAAQQQAFRRGADRRDLDTLLNWSMRRDLRTDAPPVEGTETTHGRGLRSAA